MHRTCIIAVTLFGIFAAFAAPVEDNSDAIVGTWLTKEGKARVEITRQGDTYQGTIVWLREPHYPEGDAEAGKTKHDRNNPDPALRDRPIVGLRILDEFKYVGDRTWSGGYVYDPESGNTYRGKIRLDDNGRLLLRGYVGISLLGRTEAWEPCSSETPQQNETKEGKTQ